MLNEQSSRTRGEYYYGNSVNELFGTSYCDLNNSFKAVLAIGTVVNKNWYSNFSSLTNVLLTHDYVCLVSGR